MKCMKTRVIIITVILTLCAGPTIGADVKATGQPDKNLIQMAILLDTSNSMDGLIEQAKTQLWKIVNELALAKRNGETPNLEVALYEYGKDSLPAGEGYMRMIVPLTTDLDRVSEELFKLKTNGGSEYCGQVIQMAARGLKWTLDNQTLKVIFIAGNEAFTQGKVDYKKSCREAIEKGIVVNTIFCGNFEKGVRTNWKDGALLADGKYMNIDQNQQIVHIEAPQDQEIMRLGRELNKTYISYGAMGREKKERQATQDSMASGIAPSVMVQRSVTKSSKMYKNKSWDLVDAVEEGEVTPEDLDAEDLPAEMRDMNTDERKAYVESKKKERAKIQAKIKQLNAAREAYVAEERKKMSRTNTLDAAIIDAIKTQAEKKSYKFDNSGN